jgi:hypothetical protein
MGHVPYTVTNLTALYCCKYFEFVPRHWTLKSQHATKCLAKSFVHKVCSVSDRECVILSRNNVVCGIVLSFTKFVSQRPQ